MKFAVAKRTFSFSRKNTAKNEKWLTYPSLESSKDEKFRGFDGEKCGDGFLGYPSNDCYAASVSGTTNNFHISDWGRHSSLL